MWNTSSSDTTLTVNGSVQDITNKIGRPFRDFVVNAATDAGLNKFRVYIGETEIKKGNAPSVIEEGMAISLRPYDTAG